MPLLQLLLPIGAIFANLIRYKNYFVIKVIENNCTVLHRVTSFYWTYKRALMSPKYICNAQYVDRVLQEKVVLLGTMIIFTQDAP